MHRRLHQVAESHLSGRLALRPAYYRYLKAKERGERRKI
jgi:hypothetical protein